MTSHTPLPWHLGSDGETIMASPVNGKPDTFLGIASVLQWGGERKDQVADANAALIVDAVNNIAAVREEFRLADLAADHLSEMYSEARAQNAELVLLSQALINSIGHEASEEQAISKLKAALAKAGSHA